MASEGRGGDRRFEVGEVYIASPALDGQPRKLCAVIGRDGAMLEAAFIDEIATGRVMRVCGRDFAMLTTGIGQYGISACAKAAAKDAAIVNEILKAKQTTAV